MNRRTFLQNSTLATTSTIIGKTPDWLGEKPAFNLPSDFKVQIFATNWGFKGDFPAFCKKAKDDGYDGIEIWLPQNEKSVNDLLEATDKNGLKFGFLTSGSGNVFEMHLGTFQENIQKAVALKPVFINCHSGKDYFSFEQGKSICLFTMKASKESGVPIYHETHRARLLYAAHITKHYLEQLSGLRLTLDISHWCVVHSSLLEDQKEAVNMALEHTGHVHSRVGFEQGPQINDPRSPEWEKTMAAHFAWWDKVVENAAKNDHQLTMTTEFGPPGYMPTVPFTQQPITDLWAVNIYMKELWRGRYG